MISQSAGLPRHATPAGGANHGHYDFGVDIERVVLEWQWSEPQSVGIGANEKLSFPALEDRPGVYRILVLDGNRSYIGQTVSLRKRFRNYRNPGSDPDHTNRRVHDAIRRALKARQSVIVQVVCGAQVALSTRTRDSREVNLRHKWQRVMIEQAAESSARVNHHDDLINKP